MSLPAPHGNRNRHIAKPRPLGELRAVNAPGAVRASSGRQQEDGADDRIPEQPRILVAGADPCKRAAVVRDLRETLPSDTRLGEAGAVWEVLEQAPSCGVVMLADDLGDVSARSLMRLLGRRHPRLPVVALDASRYAPARGAASATVSG
jgi:hypothetical protein